METTQTGQGRTGTDLPNLAKWLVLLTFLAYLPALSGGFVFDDGPLIIINRLVRSPHGLYRFWFSREAADYYPVTGSLWWLEWRVWGYHAIGYHAVNILLHAANAEALRLNPYFFQVYNYLGNALLKEGKVTEAIDHYRNALRIRPDFGEARRNLEMALRSNAK